MNKIPTPPLPARLFRLLFHKNRPRGYMRLGTWMARVCTSMQNVKVPLDDETWIALDLRRIDHQPIFLDGMVVWEVDERNVLECLAPEGGTAIDVGANLGVYSVVLARLVGRNGLVVAYEPQASDLLANALSWPQIILRPFAVSNTDEQVPFRRERSTALSHIVSARKSSLMDSLVVCVTLDAEVSRLGLDKVDFVKIDVEGAEEQVLEGARALLSGPFAPVIFFEWIPRFRDRRTRGALAVLHDIVGSDWRLFRIGWGQPVKEILEFSEPDEEANIIAFPPSRSKALTEFLKKTSIAPEPSSITAEQFL